MVEAFPTFGGEPSEGTEVLVGYDDTHLLIAGRFRDSDPGGMRIGSLTRDRPGSDDAFELILDTYDDNENAVGFATNPAGIRVDFSIVNNAEEVNPRLPPHDPAWNTFWDVETSVDSLGWSMEMRIPLSSLRFQEVDGRVSMGMIVRRTIARKNEEITFPGIPPEWGGSYRKPSLGASVILSGISSSKPVYISPHILTGLEKAPLARTGPPGEDKTHLTRDFGFDVKAPLADNLVLDLTANTDFAQTEVDAEQVNTGRFNLFFPEKRQFFLERAGVFDFTGVGGSRLFHSRRIGLSEEGEPIRIAGGGRLVGRIGEWDLGALDMQTLDSDSLSSENFGVIRLRRRTFNQESHAGLMVTSRAPAHGETSLSYGVDGRVHFGGTTYATASFSQSLEGGRGTLGSTAGMVGFERRSRSGFSHSQSLGWTGGSYDPGMGFVDRAGITRYDGAVDYLWVPDGDGALYNHGPGLEVLGIGRTRGGLESVEVAPGWLLNWKSGFRLDLEANGFFEDVIDPFSIGHASIPTGRYQFFSLRAMLVFPPKWRLSGRIYTRYGQLYDGKWSVLYLRPAWRVSERLSVSLDYDRTRARFPDRSERFDSDILRFRANGAFNASFSGSSFIQYSSFSEEISANAQLRYNFSEGQDLFLIYNEGLTVDPVTNRVEALGNRSLLVKFTHTFIKG
jgi:hypothetical protein